MRLARSFALVLTIGLVAFGVTNWVFSPALSATSSHWNALITSSNAPLALSEAPSDDPNATPAALPAWSSARCYGGSLVVVAHTDDDLLFINPEQQRAIKAGTCLYTAYLTAGDAGLSENYWKARERGALAAYAFMAGAVNDWEESTITSRGLHVMTLKADWRINLIFLRLPDGMQRGSGSRSHQLQSLKKLWTGAQASMSAVDGSNTYTKKQLTQTLSEIMQLTRPATVRTLDYVGTFKDADHSDHHAVAYLTKQASKAYKQPHTLFSYQGYPIASKKENVSAYEARVKLAAFDTYAEYDEVRQNRKYIPRQYVVAKSA